MRKLFLFVSLILSVSVFSQISCPYFHFTGNDSIHTDTIHDGFSYVSFDLDSLPTYQTGDSSHWEKAVGGIGYYEECVMVSSDFIDTTANANDWLLIGGIHFLNCFWGHLEWVDKISNPDKKNGYKLYLSTTPIPEDTANLTLLFEMEDSSAMLDTIWEERYCDLASYVYDYAWSGETIYLFLHHNSQNMECLFLDEIRIECICLKKEDRDKFKFVTTAYPNPASNQITIKYSLPPVLEKASLVIIDSKGRTVKKIKHIEKGVYSSQMQTQAFSVSHLKPGTYHYYIKAKGYQSESNSFIITR